MRYGLVMPAAGSGQRFGGQAKQYRPVLGRTLIEWSLAPFLADARCEAIVVALAPGDGQFAALPCARDARVRTTTGGARRADSVRAGLSALGLPGEAWVMVHDAARPCVTAGEIGRLLEGAGNAGALLAVPVADTLKIAAANHIVASTAPRDALWRAQTPQLFRAGELARALDAALASGREPTDEAQAMEWQGASPRLVPGEPTNIKVTGPGDLGMAAAILGERQGQDLRIGSGHDVHRFGPGDHVMLGGVRVPHTHGVVAHSDGDVLLHALCDAMLGAAGLGDIGVHFPDSDARWRGAPSSGFVSATRTLLAQRGLGVRQADLTLIAEAPRLGAHREAIRATIATLLELHPDAVNVKATTTEGLGFTGRREGLAAQATVLCGPLSASRG